MNKAKFSESRTKFAAKSIDELINLLASENLQTRFFAEMCLRDATNTWLNFKPASSSAEKEKAIDEWREWWKEKEGKFKKKWVNRAQKK